MPKVVVFSGCFPISSQMSKICSRKSTAFTTNSVCGLCDLDNTAKNDTSQVVILQINLSVVVKSSSEQSINLTNVYLRHGVVRIVRLLYHHPCRRKMFALGCWRILSRV